jgi:5-formyltetrahydrofolate cyclo-ligase
LTDSGRLPALQQGKLVYMAVPKLAEPKPFLLLDPEHLSADPRRAADKSVAAHIAPPVYMHQVRPVDLIVVGSVAVNARGARLGKGADYSDLEFGLLTGAGLASDRTVVAITVHELQVLDEHLPELDHDFRVDLVITADRVIECERARRPSGIDWTPGNSRLFLALPGGRQDNVLATIKPILELLSGAVDSHPTGSAHSPGNFSSPETPTAQPASASRSADR